MHPVSTKRILVIDNEAAATRMVRLALERYSVFEVCEVNDPRGALTAARLFRPDLVLLDIEMPGMDGSDVARQFRAEEGVPADADHFHDQPGDRRGGPPTGSSRGARGCWPSRSRWPSWCGAWGDLLNTLLVANGTGEPAAAASLAGTPAEAYPID